MAIKEVSAQEVMRPVDQLRLDFDEFAASDFDVVALVGYDRFKDISVRTAAIKLMKERNDNIRFFQRNHKYYLAKD